MIVYAHGPRINNETGMIINACFILEVKKENNTKKKKTITVTFAFK